MRVDRVPDRVAKERSSGTRRTILIVDDQEGILSALRVFVLSLEAEPLTATSGQEGLQILGSTPVDLVLLDIQLPDMNGLELLDEARLIAPGVPVICMTGHGTIEVAIQAMKRGARDFLLKPFDFGELSRSLRAAFRERPPEGPRIPGVKPLIGASPEIQEVWRQIDIFAPTDITILLAGESGTGKELFARAIHAKSKRHEGPWIELDCASIPVSLIESELFGHERGAFTDACEARPGKFEIASGGTLFLDELGNLSLDVQAKLLRVVQERKFRRIGGRDLVNVDVRIIGATNTNLEEAVRRGAFRPDLFYRLGEMPLEIPPLRERTGDLDLLAEHFIEEFNRRYNKDVRGVSPGAQLLMKNYSWPGNVRELENVMRSLVLTCEDEIGPRDLPAFMAKSAWENGDGSIERDRAAPTRSLDRLELEIPWPEDGEGIDLKKLTREMKARLERQILTRLLHRERMNKTRMARYLQLDFKVLREKLKAYGLLDDERPG